MSCRVLPEQRQRFISFCERQGIGFSSGIRAGLELVMNHPDLAMTLIEQGPLDFSHLNQPEVTPALLKRGRKDFIVGRKQLLSFRPTPKQAGMLQRISVSSGILVPELVRLTVERSVVAEGERSDVIEELAVVYAFTRSLSEGLKSAMNRASGVAAAQTTDKSTRVSVTITPHIREGLDSMAASLDLSVSGLVRVMFDRFVDDYSITEERESVISVLLQCLGEMTARLGKCVARVEQITIQC